MIAFPVRDWERDKRDKRLPRNKLSSETNHRGTEYTEREFLHQFWDIFLFGSL
jgi:hypothetical protein